MGTVGLILLIVQYKKDIILGASSPILEKQ